MNIKGLIPGKEGGGEDLPFVLVLAYFILKRERDANFLGRVDGQAKQ